MRVSLVTVSYRSSRHLPALLESLEGQGVDEVVVVEHSDDEGEAAAVRRLGPDRLVVQPNAGYGAGLNRGAAVATGDVLLLANPDLALEPGCVAALLAALEAGAAAAGPLLYWDRDRTWRLPHSHPVTWRFELLERLAPRRATRAYLRHHLRIWLAAAPVTVAVLGGALIATTRAAFAGSGGFDERFFLFFEENDWCDRVRRAGGRLVVVPAARVIHEWRGSVGAAEGEHYPRSLALYRRLHLPAGYRALVPSPPAPRVPALPPLDGIRPDDRLLLSPSARFVPAALHVIEDPSRPPRDLLPANAGDAVYRLGVLRGRRVLDGGTLSRG